MLTIDVEKTAQVAVVRCAGRIVRGEGIEALQDAVLANSGAEIIMLDLFEVKMLDAGGLTALLMLHEWAEDRGIRVQIVNPSRFVCEVLTSTGLDRVFEVSTFDHALWLLGADCLGHHAAC